MKSWAYHDDWPWRYQIKTRLPGQEFVRVRKKMSVAELSGAYYQVGEAVAQIHAMHFSAFGELAHDGSVLGNGQFLDAFKAHARRLIGSPRWQDRASISNFTYNHIGHFANASHACQLSSRRNVSFSDT